mmetsp:Transcript_7816/g.35442  ORF Transcript_7816/g.35442 Transcript_7816/m.35442 type:complete len:260 (-) Transcript_7816:21-800(-)
MPVIEQLHDRYIPRSARSTLRRVRLSPASSHRSARPAPNAFAFSANWIEPTTSSLRASSAKASNTPAPALSSTATPTHPTRGDPTVTSTVTPEDVAASTRLRKLALTARAHRGLDRTEATVATAQCSARRCAKGDPAAAPAMRGSHDAGSKNAPAIADAVADAEDCSSEDEPSSSIETRHAAATAADAAAHASSPLARRERTPGYEPSRTSGYEPSSPPPPQERASPGGNANSNLASARAASTHGGSTPSETSDATVCL